MQHFNPKVSIVIPVYNGSDFMKQAIDSALAQDYDNLEVIVVNDGSNDNYETDNIARSYGERIRYLTKENGGVASALNMGIRNMSGEYFSWLSHDDMYMPQKISSQINTLDKQSDKTILISCGTRTINASGTTIGLFHPLDFYKRKLLERPLYALTHCCISGCNLLVHKSHFKRVGYFKEELTFTQDFDMWFRMMRGRTICFDKNILSVTRIHKNQGSASANLPFIQECEQFWMYMMEELSNEEKYEIKGSIYMFYRDISHCLLRNSTYWKAIEFAEEKALEALKKEEKCRYSSMLRRRREVTVKHLLLYDKMLATGNSNWIRFLISLYTEGIKIALMRVYRGIQCKILN